MATDDLLRRLTYLTDSLTDASERQNLAESAFDELQSTLESSTHNIRHEKDERQWSLIVECFRCLRNSCASCQRNQEIISRRRSLFSATLDIMEACVDYDIAEVPRQGKMEADSSKAKLVLQALRCGVQFLGNAVVNFEKNQCLVWERCSPLFRNLLEEHTDLVAKNYTCMLLYNCLNADRLEQLVRQDSDKFISPAIIVHVSATDSEWGNYVLEKLMTHPMFMENTYDFMNINQICMLLDAICSKLQSQADAAVDGYTVSPQLIAFVASHFVDDAAHFLSYCNGADFELDTKFLDLLCIATSLHNLYSSVRSDLKLVATAINLLHSVEMIGRESNNVFSRVAKLSADQDGDARHPAFGLRKNLIRLIANMCYTNRQIQDKVRELGGIQLIMNHTNIDTRNPYITQWSVFAIHNICKGNAENQAVIAGMTQQGLADNVNLLKEFGVHAEMHDGKIVVKNEPTADESPFIDVRESRKS